MICRMALFITCCICLAGQNLTVQQRIDAQQKLIGELRNESAGYNERHPSMVRWNGLIAVLEDEVALLHVLQSDWTAEAVSRQSADLHQQIEALRTAAAPYQERHPEVAHLRAIATILDTELKALPSR